MNPQRTGGGVPLTCTGPPALNRADGPSAKINILAYHRPIAEGTNTTDAHLRHVWQSFKDADARTVVLSGLKFGDDHIEINP